MSTLILIRGNSGSGKTVVANKLHKILGSGTFTLLISQDYVRRQMLMVKDKPNNLAIGLIEQLIQYGNKHCEFVIIEGILAENKYGNMLRRQLNTAKTTLVYYYDLPLEETLNRHNTKDNTDFGESELRSWYTAHDYLGIRNEKTINKEMTIEETLDTILKDLKLQI